jgi:hypothetical protein
MSYYSERQRTVAINCARFYYHNSQGKHRKSVAYYAKQHPDLNLDELFSGIEPDDWESKDIKIRLYHNESKINKIKEKYFTNALEVAHETVGLTPKST